MAENYAVFQIVESFDDRLSRLKTSLYREGTYDEYATAVAEVKEQIRRWPDTKYTILMEFS